MSADSPVVGVTIVAGASSGAISTLSNTGNPIVIGLLVAGVVLIITGLMTRRSFKK